MLAMVDQETRAKDETEELGDKSTASAMIIVHASDSVETSRLR